MTDDDLVIRHLRLCQCGKVAGHSSDCYGRPASELTEDETFAALMDVARRRGIKPLDARTAIAKAEDKLELLRRWEAAYERDAASILARQENRELDRMADENRTRHLRVRDEERQRLAAKRRRMRLGRRLDTLLTDASLTPGLGTPDFVPSGPRSSHADEPPAAEAFDFGDHLVVIKSRLELMEAEWDAAHGRAPEQNWAMATTEEKDHEILTRYRGTHSRVVSEANPALGSARTIERVRREAGVRPSNGLPREDDK